MNPCRYRKTLAVLACLIALAATYWLMNARCFQLVGDLVCRGDGTRPQVALTFDDAPLPHTTEAVLATLAEKRVRGTFFAIGAQLAAQPQLAQRIAAEGHQLANHSWSHPRFLLKSPAFIAREIDDTEAQIRAAGYRGKAYFRPPYGKKLLGLPWVLKQRGMTTVMWDVDADRFRKKKRGYMRMLTDWLEYLDSYERIMFGTDWPLANLEDYIGFMKEIVPEEEWEKVFFSAANRIYGLGL